MSLYDLTVPMYTKMLKNLDGWIGKAISYAESRRFDPNVLTHARLAPDQFDLARQIQSACDTAKLAAAKLAGKDPPSHPDVESNLAELRARIHTCIDYLATFRREDFAGAEERKCSHTWMGGKGVRGAAYVNEYALPNFYFHVTTAYAILRHNGVDLGKTDYLRSLPLE